MHTKEVKPKDIIFREGDDGNEAYIIRSGQVEILKHAEHGDVQLAVLEEGNVLGEMALFVPKNNRSATARALNEVTLEVINENEFNEMLGVCSEPMRMIIHSIIQRLRDTNQRLAAKERAAVILDESIEQLTLIPLTEAAQSATDKVTVKTANLPYSIGGYPKDEANPHNNDLDIPCDGPPLMVSQRHCRIEHDKDGVFVVDLGSRFCSIVNGKVIGRGKVSNKAPLQLGENKLTLGDHTSPYKFTILAE